MTGMQYNCTIARSGTMYLVVFPDMPNVRTFGDTKAEALANAADALNGCLAADVARGMLPPKPAYHGKGSYGIDVLPHIVVAIQLRQLRGEKSQTEIANRLAITYQSYQKLENPVKGNPTVKSLERVARAMGKKLIIEFA